MRNDTAHYAGFLRKNRDGGRAQPRPALGRRPWFAFLRRARSLRRFAFAITPGSVPARRSYPPGGPLAVAGSFLGRLVGIHGVPAATAVLLRSAAVHGAFLRAPLAVAFLDATGRVMAGRLLAPWRAVRCPGATWALEIPTPLPVPDVGDRIVVLPSCAVWPES